MGSSCIKDVANRHTKDMHVFSNDLWMLGFRVEGPALVKPVSILLSEGESDLVVQLSERPCSSNVHPKCFPTIKISKMQMKVITFNGFLMQDFKNANYDSAHEHVD